MATKTLTIPTLDAHKPYREAAQRAAELEREAEDLRRKAQEAYAKVGYLEPGVATKAHGVHDELRDTQRLVSERRMEAATAVNWHLRSNPTFKAFLAGTLKALIARVAPLLAYEELRREAGRGGVHLMPLPKTAGQEISDLLTWAAEARRRGLLDGIPGELAAFVDGAS